MEIAFLLLRDTGWVDLQRDVWRIEVERETAPVDLQRLHLAPMVRAELLSDFLQEAERERRGWGCS